jgi:alcohol dehydrogenase (cytochrome c)
MAGNSFLEATPVVVDGVMYTSGQPGQVFALDARTGSQIWKYQRTPNVVNPYAINQVNRGVAILGNRVFLGTLDATLLALDARTGLPLWEVQVADAREGYSITSPPLAIKDKIIAGISGGDHGIRGFVDAYDAATGRRSYTIPQPGEAGHATWKGDSWRQGGGATWLTGTYDPDLDLIFWPVGNPGPTMDKTLRDGDNLFTCSVIALDPGTGQRKWHYQFTPGDTHDWDSTEDLVLVDRVYRGKQRRLMLHADRNGMFYVLDRNTGAFLSATPFVRQTWNTGFDEDGRPRTVPGWDASPDGSIDVFPNSGGGTNFQSPSYSPETGWFYVAYQDSGQKYFSEPATYEAGKLYWGGWTIGAAPRASAGIRAIDPESGKIAWDYSLSQGSLNNGVLATGGGVVFAATREGNLIALNARTGKLLWRFQTGGALAAAPMSYAVAGKQYVAIAAGSVLYAFALPK